MNELFIGASVSRYSTHLEKVDATTFKRSYYDNATGSNVEDLFSWNGQEFVKSK